MGNTNKKIITEIVDIKLAHITYSITTSLGGKNEILSSTSPDPSVAKIVNI